MSSNENANDEDVNSFPEKDGLNRDPAIPPTPVSSDDDMGFVIDSSLINFSNMTILRYQSLLDEAFESMEGSLFINEETTSLSKESVGTCQDADNVVVGNTVHEEEESPSELNDSAPTTPDIIGSDSEKKPKVTDSSNLNPNIKIHLCIFCTCQCSTRMELRKHIRSHAKDLPSARRRRNKSRKAKDEDEEQIRKEKHECIFCKAVLRTRNGLRIHLQVHCEAPMQSSQRQNCTNMEHETGNPSSLRVKNSSKTKNEADEDDGEVPSCSQSISHLQCPDGDACCWEQVIKEMIQPEGNLSGCPRCICHECGRLFCIISSLRKRINKIHQGVKCPFCPFEVSAAKIMKAHINHEH